MGLTSEVRLFKVVNKGTLKMVGSVAHTFNPSSWKAEAGAYL